MALVVSNLAADFETLAAQARVQAPFADVLELRLDRIGDPGVERLARLIGELDRPVIAACNGPEAYGFFTGALERRLAVLASAARAGAAYVDVDWRYASALLEIGAARRIVSRHALDGSASVGVAELERELRVRGRGGDLFKLVVEARSAEDGLDVLAHLAQGSGDLVLFASGERGSFTRVLAPLFGSPLAYAAPARIPGQPAGERTAPGQLRAETLRASWPRTGPTSTTRIFGVVGRPIAHSLSPRVHNAALRAADIDAVYVSFEPERFVDFVELAEDPRFSGLSITAPFKLDALRAARAADEESRGARAANTLVRSGEGWHAHNTDASAVRAVLERGWHEHSARRSTPPALAGARVLVLGAGGAARAVVRAALALAARPIIAARDAEKARNLAAELGADAIAWSEIQRASYDVLVHATPVGMLAPADAEPPVPIPWIRPRVLVVDAVYRPRRTAFTEGARARDCTIVGGEEWFLEQARAQFELFTGRTPDLAVMRTAFAEGLDASA